jgi:hypothetical protein
MYVEGDVVADRLIARLADMGGARLLPAGGGSARHPARAARLAERLVRQALVMEDRREEWRRAGEQSGGGAADARRMRAARRQ